MGARRGTDARHAPSPQPPLRFCPSNSFMPLILDTTITLLDFTSLNVNNITTVRYRSVLHSTSGSLHNLPVLVKVSLPPSQLPFPHGTVARVRGLGRLAGGFLSPSLVIDSTQGGIFPVERDVKGASLTVSGTVQKLTHRGEDAIVFDVCNGRRGSFSACFFLDRPYLKEKYKTFEAGCDLLGLFNFLGWERGTDGLSVVVVLTPKLVLDVPTVKIDDDIEGNEGEAVAAAPEESAPGDSPRRPLQDFSDGTDDSLCSVESSPPRPSKTRSKEELGTRFQPY